MAGPPQRRFGRTTDRGCHFWSFVEWLSRHRLKDGAAVVRREETITLLTPKIILDQWVDAMSGPQTKIPAEGSTSDCMRLIEEFIEECVQGSLHVAGSGWVVQDPHGFYLGRSHRVVRHPRWVEGLGAMETETTI